MAQTIEPGAGISRAVERLGELVESLSIEERARLTSGVDAWHAAGVDSIGLRPMLTLDGPNGVRGVTFPKGSDATCTPCGTALGATWDVDLVAEVAARIGVEAKRSGVDYLLGPVLNIVRSPLSGRDFECYSEDPLLTAEMGAAYVTGMQSQGVAACPKHFVANDSEAHRTTVNCIVDERTLREVYLLPFERAARAGAWSMMAAYNRVNGVHCSNNRALIGGILREEWGWDGVLMSDWHAMHDTVAGAAAGLDLEMPGPPRHFGPPLAAAVRRGEVDEDTLNGAAERILALAARVGALKIEGIGRGGVALPESSRPIHLSDAEAAVVVRRAAAESFVLLANDGILPLARSEIRRLAVIGPNAAAPCTQGGGAAHIEAPYAVSPLEGLRAALPADVEMIHERGCSIDLFLPRLDSLGVADLDGAPGLTIEFYRGQEPGTDAVARYNVQSSNVHLFGDLPAGLPQNDFAVRLSAWLTPASSGPHRIAMRGLGGRRLFVDGVLAADQWTSPAGVDVPTALFEGKEHGGTFELEAGKPVLITAEAHSAGHEPGLLAVGCASPEIGDPMAVAVAAAASADVAIVVVGTDETWESEGRDRKSATLPGRQDELVEGVAAVNRRTVVVVNAGCPMDLPWADRVAAVMYAWLPGQEFGHALADVLLGTAEPGGRLPVTLARRAEDFPAFDTTPGPDEELVYREGVNVGYRGFDAAGLDPRFAFGHGLGYTTFEYESLDLVADGLADGEPLQLLVRLRNTGTRAGKEVVQVYVADLECSVARPPRELKGFAAVRLAPGEAIELELALEDRDLAYWDGARHSWRIEPGLFEIGIGHSSRDIRLRRTFELA
ncbi:MAG: beta-glucosidase family protein [Candidatus Limnocylindrales bacterium]